MKISTRRDALFAQLQTVTRAASTRSAVQALSGVQLLAKGGAIELRATDMEIGLRVPLEGEVVREGAVVLPARLLVDVVRALPGDEVSLELRAVRAGRRDRRAAPRRSTSARCASRTSRPSRSRRATAASQVPGPAFVETVLKVARSASRDETRPVLTGILVSASGERAADGRDRLLPAVGQGDEARGAAGRARSRPTCRRGRCRSSRGSSQHGRAPRRSSVSVRTNQVVFEVGGVVLSSRLIDGQFPNYRQLLPDAYEHELPLAGGGDHRGRAPHLAAGAEERAAAAGVHRGRADGVGAHAGRRRGARDAAGPVRRASRSRSASTPSSCATAWRRWSRGDVLLKLISPLRPGLIEAADGSGLPVPADADPAERVGAAPCGSPASRCATSAPTSAAEVRLGPGPDGRHGPQRRRQDEPARGALLRLHRAARAGRRTSARCVRFGAGADAAGARRARTTRGAHEHHASASSPARPKRLQVDGAPVERLTDVRRRPLVVGLPARPAGARARARRRCAARTSTRSSPRCGRPAPARAAPTRAALGAAQRAARPRSAPAAPAAARCRPGTPSSPATASR